MSVSNKYICEQCILEVDDKSYLILDDGGVDKFFASTIHANDMKNKNSSYYKAVKNVKEYPGKQNTSLIERIRM